jgi:putative ABC transport system substrate-binding protein
LNIDLRKNDLTGWPQSRLARLPVDVFVTNPIRAGFVASLAHPGENITGNSILGPEVGVKRLQLLKLAVPTMLRAAFLWNPNNASHLAYLDEWKAVAPALGVGCCRRRHPF